MLTELNGGKVPGEFSLQFVLDSAGLTSSDRFTDAQILPALALYVAMQAEQSYICGARALLELWRPPHPHRHPRTHNARTHARTHAHTHNQRDSVQVD